MALATNEGCGSTRVISYFIFFICLFGSDIKYYIQVGTWSIATYKEKQKNLYVVIFPSREQSK